MITELIDNICENPSEENIQTLHQYLKLQARRSYEPYVKLDTLSYINSKIYKYPYTGRLYTSVIDVFLEVLVYCATLQQNTRAYNFLQKIILSHPSPDVRSAATKLYEAV